MSKLININLYFKGRNVSTVGGSGFMNKEPSNNKNSNDIKSNTCKEAESVTDKAKVSNGIQESSTV